jgi:hypothetical protein
MENNLSINDRSHRRARFWKQQFNDSPTQPQTIFDIIFGVAMPVLCFLLDPGIIGKGLLSPGSFLFRPIYPYNFFVYALSAMAILSLAAWLFAGRRLGKWSSFFVGVFLPGAMLSFAIGCFIFPLTLMGLVALIGLLGLTPFFTAFVYLRNGVRAMRASRASSRRSQIIATALLGAVVIAGISTAGQIVISKMTAESIDQILHSEAAPDEAVARLRYLRSFVDVAPLFHEYEKETDPARKDRLAKAYEEITRENIESLFID